VSTAAESPIITRFDHVTVAVAALQPAVERYRALLGSEPVWRGQHADAGTETALFGLKNAVVELVAPRPGDERAEGLRALLDARGEGILTLAFGTDDAAACRDALRARGVPAAPPESGEAVPDGDGERRTYRSVELSPRATRGIPVLAVERDDFGRLLRPTVDSSAACDALDHLVIFTSEPDAAIGLYRDAMGIRLALDRPLGDTRMLFFRVGGVTLEVVQKADAGAQDSFYGMAYRVADLDAAHARLQAAGFGVSQPREGNKPGTRVFTVRDGTCGVPTLVLRDPSRDRPSAAGGGAPPVP
jgi:catechol 2,3-dioxygenase-like lactoylglutathione lyase family enzyme